MNSLQNHADLLEKTGRPEEARQFIAEQNAEKERREAIIKNNMERNEKERQQAERLATKNGFDLTSLSVLYRESVEEVAYLWENTLIKGGLSILVAKPKAGKSTLARNLALAIANGQQSFLGRNVTASGSVVYLALEEMRSEVKNHFQRMGAPENLPIFIHTGSAPQQAIDELRKAIIESKAVFAIVDPLQRLVRIKDLNDYASVSLALEPLTQIARDTGCHTLLIHHANKGLSRDGGDSILGSTAIFGSVDCALIMKRGEAYRTIESIQRYGVDLPRTVLNFDVATGLTSPGGSLEDAQVTACGKAIIEFIDGHEVTEREIKEAITDYNSGIKSKSLRALCQDGIVQRQGEGKKGGPYTYSITDKNAGYSGSAYKQKPTIPTIPKTEISGNLATNNAEMVGIEITDVPQNIVNPNTQHFAPNQPDDCPPDDPPYDPTDDIPPDDDPLESWEKELGITLGSDPNERHIGYRPEAN
jgi:predicted ATP-dependent serine protease